MNAQGLVMSKETPTLVLNESGYWVVAGPQNLSLENNRVNGRELTLEQQVVRSEASQVISMDGETYLSSGHSGAGCCDIIYGQGVNIEAGQVKVSTLVSRVSDKQPKVLVQGSEGVVLEMGDGSVLSGGNLGQFARVGEYEIVDGEYKFYRGVDAVKVEAGHKVVLKETKAYIEYALDMDGATLVLDRAELSLGRGEAKTTVAEMVVNNNNSDKNTIVIRTGQDAMRELGLEKRPVVNATIQGTGKLCNVQMQGGTLKAGDAPGNKLGVLSIQNVETGRAGESSAATEWKFTLSTDGAYDFKSANTDASGKFSQLKLVGYANHGEDVTIVIDYADAGGTAADKGALKEKFELGSSITLIDTTEGSVSGNYVFDMSQLPELGEGLLWYADDFFKDGTVTVVNELWADLAMLSGDYPLSPAEVDEVVTRNQVADSARLAGTMLAAAETTAGFGRMALSHADDDRAWRSNFWGAAYYQNSDCSGSASRTGFGSSTFGYAVGLDTRITKFNAVAGVALGRSYGEVKPDHGNSTYSAGKIEQDGVNLGLYGRLCELPTDFDDYTVNVDAFMSLGFYDCKSRRHARGTGEELQACWDEKAFAMGVSASRNYQWRHGIVLTPWVGLEYSAADMDSLREMGYTAVDYSCSKQYRNLALQLGAGASRTLRLRNGQELIPYGRAMLGFDMLRQSPEVRATTQVGTVRESAPKTGRVSLQLNLGSDWIISRRWRADAGYTLQLRSNEASQSLYLSASRSF